jgi:hypothetical protein
MRHRRRLPVAEPEIQDRDDNRRNRDRDQRSCHDEADESFPQPFHVHPPCLRGRAESHIQEVADRLRARRTLSAPTLAHGDQHLPNYSALDRFVRGLRVLETEPV